MKYVGEKSVDEITLDIFSGNASFELYEDDGESISYTKNDFSKTTISVASGDKTFSLKISRPEGKFVPEKHGYLIKYRSAAKPKSVMQNGSVINSSSWWMNEAEGALYIRANAET
jgi:alpha-glucosidase